MKRRVILGVLALIALVVAVVVIPHYSSGDGVTINGNSTVEKLASLAETINASDAGKLVQVNFKGYNADMDAWEFSMFVAMPIRDVLGSSTGTGSSSIERYAFALQTVFVETSRIVPVTSGSIVLDSVFADLNGRRDSTSSIANIVRDPSHWANFLNKSVLGEFVTQTELDLILKAQEK